MDAAPSYALLTDLDEIKFLTERLAQEKKPVGVDCETSYHGDSREGAALHAEENYVASVQFTNDLSWARMVPLAFDAGPNADNRAVAALLWPLFHVTDDAGLPLVVAHGAVAELRWLGRWFLRKLWDHPLYGRQVRAAHGYFPVRSCTMLESYAEGINERHGLKPMTALPAPAGFGHQMRELTDGPASLLGRLLRKEPTAKQKKSVRFSVFDAQDPEVIAYACEDAVYALAHHLRRWRRVKDHPIYKLEMANLPIGAGMSDVGVAYDWDLLRARSSEVSSFCEKLTSELVGDFEALAGGGLRPDLNFGSSDHLVDLLYNRCGMPVAHLTDGGKPSVDAKNALPALAKQYPAVKKLMSLKKLIKLNDSFLKIYERKYSWAPDGRAHPSWNQHGTIGGRWSCNDMNVQQSPSKYHCELADGTALDFNFRDAIISARPGHRPWYDLVLEEEGCPDLPEPGELGWYFIGGDYSQIELRVMAAEAGETRLLEAYKAGIDVHRQTAALMLAIAMEEVSKAERAAGKTRNFANIYGQGPKALADQLGISLEEAQEKDQQYNALYPHMKPYRRRVIAEARSKGHVTTKFGRRITLHKIHDANPKLRAKEEMTAGNAVIQGPATGDFVKMVMVKAARALEKAGLGDRVRLVMNIHDALTWEAREDVSPEEVIAVLQPAVVFPVNGPGAAWPEMVFEWYTGPSWGQLRDIVMGDDGVVRYKDEEKAAVTLKIVPEPEQDPELLPDEEPAPRPERRRALAAVPDLAPELPSGPGREVIVTLSSAPSRDQAQRLLRFLKEERPGPDAVVVAYAGTGKRVPLGISAALTPDDGARVRVMLGAGAEVRYAPGSDGPTVLTSGRAV